MLNIASPDYDHKAARKFFTESLHESVDYLIDFYELDDVKKSPPLSWQMCAAHYLAAKSAESEDHDSAIKYLKYIESIPVPDGIVISPLTSSDKSFDKEMILKIIHDDKELGFGFCDDKNLAAVEAEKVSQAIDVIKENAPDTYEEINTFIHSVHLTRETSDGSRFMRSGTNFYMWGMMFTYVHEEHTVPYYIDILAHECGHTALNIINSFDELVVNNPNDTFVAPLRVDNRPMIGIFHALFVLSRICYVFDSIIKRGTSEYVEECKERFSIAFKKLNDTYEIVKEHGRFTEAGQTIYEDICKLWKLN
ncbi:MAG: aKG-HExxH-type peptide beta-hydroxylase [Pantoea agglomerans]